VQCSQKQVDGKKNMMLKHDTFCYSVGYIGKEMEFTIILTLTSELSEIAHEIEMLLHGSL
jgi:hypothetical protein